MVTTIQVSERTLLLLKKLKRELDAASYDEAIERATMEKMKTKSMAGSLSKNYKNKSLKEILKNLRDKSDRF